MAHLIAWLLVGLIAGALAGRVVEGSGFGFLGDVVVGLVGAFIGGLILHAITRSDVAGSFVGECIVAFLGACILLGLLRAVGRGAGGGRGATAGFGR
ncbi:MAG: GlsB/YeaQ/YmgE family stress response rane protein [Acidobacteriales bacterium]|jgi:uncharacterized membrane protein YeaQ/YmgE (transglycosylase-associated protein family)|nr:GlsB/YeaQ/YmgE family stress response rane protein [Terriglobales bacterium]